MWQRIQTIFLALVVIVMIVSMFFPIWKHVDSGGVRYELYPLQYSIINGDQRTVDYIPYSITAVLMIAAASVAVQTIRRYDNRLLQIKLAAFNTLLLMGVMGAVVYFGSKFTADFQHEGLSRGALWTIFAGVAMNWVAMRFIRRDERIVKDSERLR
ncbi:MAG TPA: DUF4293 domain-containing protein [Cyclobacteriaceae bacterium]|nr:DUF4293 domain-containing protein [Cyclobacteriaceae bacterium]